MLINYVIYLIHSLKLLYFALQKPFFLNNFNISLNFERKVRFLYYLYK